MNRAYSLWSKLEEWDQIATEQQWEPEWVEHIGLALYIYLQERVNRNKGASLAGFIDYLGADAPRRNVQ